MTNQTTYETLQDGTGQTKAPAKAPRTLGSLSIELNAAGIMVVDAAVTQATANKCAARVQTMMRAVFGEQNEMIARRLAHKMVTYAAMMARALKAQEYDELARLAADWPELARGQLANVHGHVDGATKLSLSNERFELTIDVQNTKLYIEARVSPYADVNTPGLDVDAMRLFVEDEFVHAISARLRNQALEQD